MSIYDLFDEIEAIWKKKNRISCIEELNMRISRGSTGGEIFSDVTQFFSELKSREDESYLDVKNLIDESLVRYENFIKQV